MGALNPILGTGGGAAGTGFGGPTQSSQAGSQEMTQAYNQLQQVASGQGPNPAMAQYNANIQNQARQQAGAISSVQGISPALAARMASQQGSAAMQNSAAEAAAAQGQQQLGAMGQMGQIGSAQQGAANQMMGNINTNNAGLAQTGMQGQQGMMGGIMQGIAKGGSSLFGAEGGMVPQKMAAGGTAGPQSDFGKYFTSISGNFGDMGGIHAGPNNGAEQLRNAVTSSMTKTKGPASTEENAGQGPTQEASNAMGTGIPYAQPMATGFAHGGNVGTKLKAGGKVPGTPKFAGNNYANDVVSAKLSPGEVVIPNNIMQSGDPAGHAAAFIQNIISKRRGGV